LQVTTYLVLKEYAGFNGCHYQSRGDHHRNIADSIIELTVLRHQHNVSWNEE
jgi:hypothetical protein